MRRLTLAPLVPLAALLALPLLSPPAAAQQQPLMRGPLLPDAPPNAGRPAIEPPALPGLAGRARTAPIPAEPGQNLSPNEALFDAINRGDLAAARDAVTRGADLNARNMLGLTPLDSAVDQGRSEITFFLLSTRPAVVSSGAPSGGAPLSAPPVAGPAPSGATPPAAFQPASPPAGLSPGAFPSAAAREVPLAAPPLSALRIAPAPTGRPAPGAAPNRAAGGGAPQPDRGFLGFDAGRPGGG